VGHKRLRRHGRIVATAIATPRKIEVRGVQIGRFQERQDRRAVG
jgi:hypothetical protein